MTLRLRVDGAKPARIWLLQCNSMLLSPLPLGGHDYPNDDEVVLPDLAMDEEQYVVSPLFPGSSKDDERLSPLAQALREAAAMVVEEDEEEVDPDELRFNRTRNLPPPTDEEELYQSQLIAEEFRRKIATMSPTGDFDGRTNRSSTATTTTNREPRDRTTHRTRHAQSPQSGTTLVSDDDSLSDNRDFQKHLRPHQSPTISIGRKGEPEYDAPDTSIVSPTTPRTRKHQLRGLPFSKIPNKEQLPIKRCPVPDCKHDLPLRLAETVTFKDIADFYQSVSAGNNGNGGGSRVYVPPLLASYVLPTPETSGSSSLGGHTYHRVLRRRYALLVKEPRFMHRSLKVCKSCALMFRRRARMEYGIMEEGIQANLREQRKRTVEEIKRRRERGPTVPSKRFDRLATKRERTLRKLTGGHKQRPQSASNPRFGGGRGRRTRTGSDKSDNTENRRPQSAPKTRAISITKRRFSKTVPKNTKNTKNTSQRRGTYFGTYATPSEKMATVQMTLDADDAHNVENTDENTGGNTGDNMDENTSHVRAVASSSLPPQFSYDENEENDRVAAAYEAARKSNRTTKKRRPKSATSKKAQRGPYAHNKTTTTTREWVSSTVTTGVTATANRKQRRPQSAQHRSKKKKWVRQVPTLVRKEPREEKEGDWWRQPLAPVVPLTPANNVVLANGEQAAKKERSKPQRQSLANTGGAGRNNKEKLNIIGKLYDQNETRRQGIFENSRRKSQLQKKKMKRKKKRDQEREGGKGKKKRDKGKGKKGGRGKHADLEDLNKEQIEERLEVLRAKLSSMNENSENNVPDLVVEKEPEEEVLEVPVLAEVPVQEKIFKIDNEDDYVYEDDFDEQHVDAQHERMKNRAVPLAVSTPTIGTTTESRVFKDRLGLEEEEDEPFLSVLRKKVFLANSQRSIEIRGESPPPPSSPTSSSSGPFSQFPTDKNAAQLNHINVSVF